MSLMNIVKSSEDFWRPKGRTWDFCGLCCADNAYTSTSVYYPSAQDQSKKSLYQKEKYITHYWSKEDDQKLIKLNQKYKSNWDLVAEKFSDKTAAQLAKRWKTKLDPSVKSTAWTEDEDMALKSIVMEIGYQWENASKYLQGRTSEACRKRFMCSIYPYLFEEDLAILSEKNNKGKATKKPIDLDQNTLHNINSEDYLLLLTKQLEELQLVFSGTKEEIERLEHDIYDSESLLS